MMTTVAPKQKQFPAEAGGASLCEEWRNRATCPPLNQTLLRLHWICKTVFNCQDLLKSRGRGMAAKVEAGLHYRGQEWWWLLGWEPTMDTLFVHPFTQSSHKSPIHQCGRLTDSRQEPSISLLLRTSEEAVVTFTSVLWLSSVAK